MKNTPVMTVSMAIDDVKTKTTHIFVSYANHSALEFLMHLKTTHGFINPTQLADNYNKMTAPIIFQDPI
jgi:hypothetical protein